MEIAHFIPLLRSIQLLFHYETLYWDLHFWILGVNESVKKNVFSICLVDYPLSFDTFTHFFNLSIVLSIKCFLYDFIDASMQPERTIKYLNHRIFQNKDVIYSDSISNIQCFMWERFCKLLYRIIDRISLSVLKKSIIYSKKW